jgi:hypothetical protein
MRDGGRVFLVHRANRDARGACNSRSAGASCNRSSSCRGCSSSVTEVVSTRIAIRALYGFGIARTDVAPSSGRESAGRGCVV